MQAAQAQLLRKLKLEESAYKVLLSYRVISSALLGNSTSMVKVWGSSLVLGKGSARHSLLLTLTIKESP